MQAGGYINTVSKYVPLIKGDISEVNAYPDLGFEFTAGSFLYFNRTLYCITGTIELGQVAISHFFDKCTVKLPDAFGMDFPVFSQHLERMILVFTHKGCITNDVGKHNGR